MVAHEASIDGDQLDKALPPRHRVWHEHDRRRLIEVIHDEADNLARAVPHELLRQAVVLPRFDLFVGAAHGQPLLLQADATGHFGVRSASVVLAAVSEAVVTPDSTESIVTTLPRSKCFGQYFVLSSWLQ